MEREQLCRATSDWTITVSWRVVCGDASSDDTEAFGDVEMELIAFLVLIALMFIFATINSSLGQGYGTLGTPILLLLGYGPKIVVPLILVSQAIAGITGTLCHNKLGNADFGGIKKPDTKKVCVIVLAGIMGVIVGASFGVKISKDLLMTFIGVSVTTMGIIILSGKVVTFTWRRLSIIGAISATLKGIGGGSYGPVVAGGQSIIGVEPKRAVAITNFAEIMICAAGFVVWAMLSPMPPTDMMLAMCVGAGTAPVLGAYITHRVPPKYFRKILGAVILVLGIFCLFKILGL